MSEENFFKSISNWLDKEKINDKDAKKLEELKLDIVGNLRKLTQFFQETGLDDNTIQEFASKKKECLKLLKGLATTENKDFIKFILKDVVSYSKTRK